MGDEDNKKLREINEFDGQQRMEISFALALKP